MDPEIERLPLEHPLPDEIQSMPKDDTVCQFCGVSYFIHREVKMLEEKVKAVEAELKECKDYKEKYEQLQQEIRRLRETEEFLRDELKMRDLSLEQLKLTVTQKEGLVQQKQEELGKLSQDYDAATTTITNLRNRNKTLRGSLSRLHSTVREQKSLVGDVRADFQKVVSDHNKAFGQIGELVGGIRRKSKEEIRNYRQQIENLSSANRDLERRHAESSKKARSSEDYLMNIQKLQQEMQVLQSREGEYRSKTAAMESKLETAEEKERATLAEVAQFKQLLQNKGHEVEEVTTQHKRQDKIAQDLITKLRLEIRQKIEALEKSETERNAMEQAIDNRRRQAEEIQQRARVSTDEVEALKGMVARVTEECSTLRKEREMMIHSHQTRIEQLKESFKKKLEEADSWPAKMDGVLKQEKDRHNAALAELERTLRETFQVEIEIERQKAEEVIRKEKQSSSVAESKFKADLDSVSSKYQDEITRLKGRLEDASRNSVAKEQTLKQEAGSLKAVITDLENRLGKLHSTQENLSRDLKAELKEAEDDLSTSRSENRQLREMLEKARDEVLVLQETVHRECEERLELTDALGVAKEQMLKLHRENSILSKAKTLPSRTPEGDVFPNTSKPPNIPNPCPPPAGYSSRPNVGDPLPLLNDSGNDHSSRPSLNIPRRPVSGDPSTNGSIRGNSALKGSEDSPSFTVQSGRKTKKGGNRRKVAPNNHKR